MHNKAVLLIGSLSLLVSKNSQDHTGPGSACPAPHITELMLSFNSSSSLQSGIIDDLDLNLRDFYHFLPSFFQTDTFALEAADLGKLFKVKIRHDNSSFSPDWYLDRVEVTDPEMGDEYTFHCERWLGKKKDDGKIERSLYVKVTALKRSD